MKSRIGKNEWKALFAVSGTIDVIQWVADFVIGPGEVVNEIADLVIGISLAAYFQLRGVPVITRPKRLAALVGGYLAEALTVSVAPAWIIDVWIIHKSVLQEEAQIKAAQEEEMMLKNAARQPSNSGGIRLPAAQSAGIGNRQPLNANGIRMPR